VKSSSVREGRGAAPEFVRVNEGRKVAATKRARRPPYRNIYNTDRCFCITHTHTHTHTHTFSPPPWGRDECDRRLGPKTVYDTAAI